MPPIPAALDALLASFPIRLRPPWGQGWHSRIAVELTDGFELGFRADGLQLDVELSALSDPICKVRADSAKLVRLLQGQAALALLFAGLQTTSLAELLALQAVVCRCRKSSP